MRVIKNSLLLIALIYSFSTMNAQESNLSKISNEAKEGMAFFQGEKRFENDGPSCYSCHNIYSTDLELGGTFAKDLSDVYSRLGDGLTAWLSAPTYEPMVASYRNNELTENERESLTAYLKHVNEVSVSQTHSDNGTYIFLVGSFLALLVLLAVFSFTWKNRKSEMVKQDIFNRIVKANDARF